MASSMKSIKEAVRLLRKMVDPANHLAGEIMDDAAEREIMTLYADMTSVSVLLNTANGILNDLVSSLDGFEDDYEFDYYDENEV